MAKRPTRLRFTEDDLSSDAVKKAAGKAEIAAAKAEKAVDKNTPKKHRKLRQEADVSASRTAKLRFGKAKADDIPPKPSGIKRTATHAPVDTLSANVHKSISRYEDDNVGVQTAHQTELGAETAYHVADHAVYSHKLKAYDKAEKLVSKSDKANVNALFEKFKKDNPNASSNPLSRWQQKHNIKKEYAAARAGKGGKATAKGAEKTAKGAKSLTQKITDFCVSHKTALLWVLAIGLLFMVISGMFASCSTMFQGGTQVVLGTSFTAEDEDILGTDEDYTALENDLRSQVDNIESTHPGYDEYRYTLDEIGHNPYELASYLTVVFEDYTREEVQATLQQLFEQQYELILEEEVEIRTRTETRTGTRTHTDPETGETWEEEYEYEVEVEYEYYILNVTLRNYGLGNVIRSSGLSADQLERYEVLLETLGNRSYLFGEDVSSAPGGGGEYTDYDIPGEALTDTAFANMIREAEKYLGYPYVWGGSSPSTSFDCSGFVSWVINNCGNGWSVGRQTANGLKNLCAIIPPSEAKPGDLIFFQGTYNTSGASHVGIYVGNGMMIHCGDVRPDRTEVEVDERRAA
ncbi:C40 family peptidase [Enterocloster clostridioformis]|uniref:C40 family peptidase n=1 Tax=Enterocloster clostridioformis TaxID=1531 RepID=UPI00232E67DF|nr:C40 family peptidase [Enterocloster clostridioformis]MDB2133540.1 C40 family peptidase [Enterocloster clostridioformis]